MHIRRAPELHFTFDNTLDHAMHIERLLRVARESTDMDAELSAPRTMALRRPRGTTRPVTTPPDPLIHGVLPVDKPAGPTSHDVVALARRALRTRRIGHTGTLDPFATGLLLLCVGHATRIAEYLSGMDKRYSATVRLGVATDTDDSTGTVTARADTSAITTTLVEQALAPFRGAVLQTPPQYSAKKRGGERAYTAARQGRAVSWSRCPFTFTNSPSYHWSRPSSSSTCCVPVAPTSARSPAISAARSVSAGT
jgi:tRNA pseudouridine(55) synthase